MHEGISGLLLKGYELPTCASLLISYQIWPAEGSHWSAVT